MEERKKTLLIFFGELRTFEYVIPHLEKLNNVDVILSTWTESKKNNIFFSVDEILIKKILPNIKQFYLVDSKTIPNIDSKWNSWKIYYHWKNAINNISDLNNYENVIFHRCDLISNWDSILDFNIENETIYLHHENVPYFTKKYSDAFWINDFYFFGKVNIVKKFVNLFDKDNYETPHLPIWEVVSKNEIKIKNYVLKAFLVRDSDVEYINKFTLRNEKFRNFSLLSGPNQEKIK